uniref:Uncharacterized protein n=1 Tax=Anguilla anguilla TaxID=7936 RepID=A0A0E9WLS4_ANGAN
MNDKHCCCVLHILTINFNCNTTVTFTILKSHVYLGMCKLKSIHPFSKPHTPGHGCREVGAYHSRHWVKGRNIPWTGHQSVAGPIHHLLTHSYPK